jgi:hypothetical protein
MTGDRLVSGGMSSCVHPISVTRDESADMLQLALTCASRLGSREPHTRRVLVRGVALADTRESEPDRLRLIGSARGGDACCTTAPSARGGDTYSGSFGMERRAKSAVPGCVG